MTSETPNLHVSKNLNIPKTKQDIEKLKTPLRLVWKCCSDAFKIRTTIFRRRGTLSTPHIMYSIDCCYKSSGFPQTYKEAIEEAMREEINSLKEKKTLTKLPESWQAGK